MAITVTDSAALEPVDLAIIRALQVAPRVPVRALAAVIGTSEQTVARRYRRMQRDGILRVTAVLNPLALGQSVWMVRAQCRPDGAESLGRALAQRDDVSWVMLVSGGSEVVCSVRSRTQQAREDLLIQRLPRTAPVLGLTMSVVLHRFLGGGATDEWAELAAHLDDAQHAALQEWAPAAVVDSGQFVLEPSDAPLVDALVADGRASYAALAAAGGLSEGRAARRLAALLDSGAVYLDVDLSAAALGFHSAAVLWLTVTPAELERAGAALSREPQVAYAAAVSGAQNLTASVMCRDLAALYDFVTAKVGSIAGVNSLEVSPVLRAVKQAGSLTSGDRLVS